MRLGAKALSRLVNPDESNRIEAYKAEYKVAPVHELVLLYNKGLGYCLRKSWLFFVSNSPQHF